MGENRGNFWEPGTRDFGWGKIGLMFGRAFAWWKMMENRVKFWEPGFRVGFFGNRRFVVR